MDEAVNVRCYVLPFIDYGLGYFDDATSGIGLTVAPTVLGRFSEYASRPIARIGCCASPQPLLLQLTYGPGLTAGTDLAFLGNQGPGDVGGPVACSVTRFIQSEG
jgi:hypothetical protein